jgi:glycosyltransferase 2 family protein
LFERLFRPLLRASPTEEPRSAPERPRNAFGRRLARWIPVVLVIGGCAYLGASVDLGALRTSLASVKLAPLGFSIVLAGLGVVAHAAFWATLLGGAARIPLKTMTEYTFASAAANVLLPFRGGEALRLWLLKRHHGVPLVTSGAAIALEKVGDALSLFLVVAPLPWLVSSLPPPVARVLRVMPILAIAIVVAVVVLSRIGIKARWLSGFRVIREPRRVVAGFAFVALAWAIDVASILTVLWAFGIDASLARALVVLLLVNVAIAIPAAPGQVGSHELGSTVALELQGVPPAQAIAFALVFHGTQLAPVIALGLYSARALSKLDATE